MIELIIFVLVVLFSAAITYGKGPPSGRVTLTGPSEKKSMASVGRGPTTTHAPLYSDSKGPLPVGLRSVRQKTETWREAERVHEEE